MRSRLLIVVTVSWNMFLVVPSRAVCASTASSTTRYRNPLQDKFWTVWNIFIREVSFIGFVNIRIGHWHALTLTIYRTSKQTIFWWKHLASAKYPTSVFLSGRTTSIWLRHTRRCKAPCSGWLPRSSIHSREGTTPRSTFGVSAVSSTRCGRVSDHGAGRKQWLFCST